MTNKYIINKTKKYFISLGNLQLVKVEVYNLSEADPEISARGG